ncbi:MAG: radical SAM protein [Lachnospiraceae bacterium]|nr:radical SAM protein [Lachnospiraceae bacterium]
MNNNHKYKVYLDCSEIRCKPSAVLTSKIFNYILENGHTIERNLKEADILIMNACGASDPLEKTSIDNIKIFLKNRKKEALVVMLGCLPKINPKILQPLSNQIIVLSNTSDLDFYLYRTIKYNALAIDYIDQRIYSQLKLDYHDGAFGALLKKVEKIYRSKWSDERFEVEICQGCPFQCSYCAMNRSRGNHVVSRQPSEILLDLGNHLKEDKIITLVADDCGGYGMDIDSSLPTLIHEIHNKFPQNGIDIYYLNPYWIQRYEEEYMELFQTTRIDSVTIPIQSGSDRILSKMNRHYKADNINNIAKKIKKISPHTTVVTHLMVGFPGEKLKDYIKTIRAIHNYDICNPIVYSDRPDTKSSIMPNKDSNFKKKAKHLFLLILCTINFIFKKSTRQTLNRMIKRNR